MLNRLAFIGIGFINLQAMFVIVIAMSMVHVTIMQVVGVVSVSDLGVTAVFTVLMVVIFMYITFFGSHDPLLECLHRSRKSIDLQCKFAEYVTLPKSTMKCVLLANLLTQEHNTRSGIEIAQAADL
jgi:hypothetical protein